MTDVPANIAQAARAWALLEAHLVERCGLGSSVSLERERPALIRIMLAALDGQPVQAPALPPAPLPANPPPRRPPKYAAGVWFSGFDLPAPDLAAARTDGPGFDCRACGKRVRRARHANPRLLCPACTSTDTGQ